jgi:hypothetical protein
MRILENSRAASPIKRGFETDESYFARAESRGDTGAYGKIIVFGLHKRCSKVYAEIVPDAKHRLARFKRIPRKKLTTCIKEAEFHFNHRAEAKICILYSAQRIS